MVNSKDFINKKSISLKKIVLSPPLLRTKLFHLLFKKKVVKRRIIFSSNRGKLMNFNGPI